MDRISIQARSKNMSAVKSAGNKSTELSLINLFKQEKIKGWRRKIKIYGKPDFVFPEKRIVVFVDGCFWHGCKKHKTIPKQNNKFWAQKISKNIERDKLVTLTLRKGGWRVVRIWEHDINKRSKKVIEKIKKELD